MGRDAGVRARPWDRDKFKSVGRHEVKLKPSTRLPSYLADPSQNRWESDSSVWATASSQVGAHYGSKADGQRVATLRRAEAGGAARFERGDVDKVWQRSSDAFGGHYCNDALGLVDIGAERIKHHKTQAHEVGDTLRWAPRADDSKSAAKARLIAEHAARSSAETTDTLRWREGSGHEDRESRTNAPDKRRIVGLLARCDSDSLALPPQRSAPARVVAGKVGQPTPEQLGGDPNVAMQYRTANGVRMEQMRKMRELKPDELDALAGGRQPSMQTAATQGLKDAMADPRVAAALNVALNAPNRMAGELYKLKNTSRH